MIRAVLFDNKTNELNGADNRMRLLFISRDEFPPIRPDVEVLFVRELTARGLSIDWILTPRASSSHSQLLNWNGGKVWLSANPKASNILGKLINRLRGWINEARAIRLILNDQYDILQIKDRFLSCLIAWILKCIFRKKFIFTYWLSYPYHEEYLDRAKHERLPTKILLRLRAAFTKGIIKNWIIPLADHIFVQSDTMAADLIQLGAKAVHLTAVPMGVDPQKIPELTTTEIKPEVVYLGTLSRVRKLDFLMRVMKLVLEKTPNARLKLIGKGELNGDLEFLLSQARDLSIQQNVDFIGQLPQTDAWALLANAAVCVSPIYPSPTFICSSPTKLVEYMALGKATVANDIPEQKLLLTQSKAGFCVEWKEEMFAEAIIKLLNNPALCRSMGEAGKKYILEHRTYPILAAMVKAKYDALVNAK